MRYFFTYDDSLSRLYRHDSGYMVNRKPLVLALKPTTSGRKRGASTRMAKNFLKKLKGLGL